MPIAIDSTNISTSSGSGGTSGSWSHTIGYASGTSRVLILGVSIRGGTNNVTSALYNGNSLTAGPGIFVDQFGYRTRISMWYMLDVDLPSSTGAYNILFNFTGTPFEWSAGAFLLRNVVQGAPEATTTNSQNSGTSISTNLAGVSDQSWVVDGLAVDLAGVTATAGAGQTRRWSVNNSGTYLAGSTDPQSGSGTATLSWTLTGGTPNASAHALASFQFIGAAAPTNAPFFGCNF